QALLEAQTQAAQQAAAQAINLQIDNLNRSYVQAKNQEALYHRLVQSGSITTPGLTFDEANKIIAMKVQKNPYGAYVYDWAKQQLDAAQAKQEDVPLPGEPGIDEPSTGGNTRVERINQHWLDKILIASELNSLYGIDPENPLSVQQVKTQVSQGQIPEALKKYAESVAQSFDTSSVELDPSQLADGSTDMLSAGMEIPEVKPAPFDSESLLLGIESAKQAVNTANIAVESAQNQLDQALEAYNEGKVLATIDGEVLQINIEPGMKLETLVQSGKAAAQIVDLSKLKAQMNVNELDILHINKETKAELTFNAIPDLVQSGEVDVVSASPLGSENAQANALASMGGAQGGASVVSYPVSILINSPDKRLKSGMSTDITLTVEKLENVIMVPLTAVNNDGTKDYVTKVTYDANGVATNERVDVVIISSNETVSVVEGNIKAGDKVQIAGNDDTGIPGLVVD
ncbi:MAG: efflux RND transporter periplasmic adaptor subunit, partial [Coriobacteriia bacterium]|nr:efflux RND transporter periplasmic adaptor subunit [Coriobacteriia bacterium]